MNQDSKNLPDNIRQSLRQLHQSHQDSQLLSDHGLSLLYPDDMVKRIKQKLTPPEWALTTDNLLTGNLAGKPVIVNLVINFDLDTDSLLSQHQSLNQILEQGFPELTDLAASAGLETPLSNILINSLKPRSYGLTTKIKFLDYQLSSFEKPQINSPQLVEMVLDQGSVLLDYSRILSHAAAGQLLIPPEEFSRYFSIPIRKLSGKAPFTSSFSLTTGQFNLVVKAQFSPLTKE